MKAQDFRIGNLIRPKIQLILADLKTPDVSAVSVLHLMDLENYGFEKWAFEPIPLTEQWLLDFGFNKIEATDVFDNFNYPYWAKNGVILMFNSSPPENTYKLGYGEMRSGKYYATFCRWINNVHTLQNAYMSFTGQELTVKTK